MEKAEGEDETVEARETAAPIAGAPAAKKRKEGAGDIVEASGAGICDDVLSNILARLPARSAVASMVLSKHHLALICSPEFRSLHFLLSPPLPRPHIAFIATAPIKRRPDHECPVSTFHGFHVGNAPMHTIAGARYLDTKYINTCNGIVLLARKRFSHGQCRCTLWNPAVADHAKEVTVPDSPLEGDLRVLALGYGRRSDTYKILLCRKEKARRYHYHKCRDKYPLLIYELGNAMKQPLLLATVLMGPDEEIEDMSLYMDGTIYLHFDKSVILAFDVDNETVSTIDLPGKGQEDEGWEGTPQLLEMSGRPCVAANRGHRRALWILTVDHRWEQTCIIAKDNGLFGEIDDLYNCLIIGVWDCGDMLVLLFERDMLCLYHVPTAKMFMAKLPYGLLPDGSDFAMCWGYRPTLLSPRSATGKLNQDKELRQDLMVDGREIMEPVKEQDRRKGHKATLDTICFMKFLVCIMRKLPENVEDVVNMPLLVDSDDPIFFSQHAVCSD